MQVKEGMSAVSLTAGPGHTLREAARLMAKRGVGAAIVIDPDEPGPGIITERDLLQSLGAGEDPDQEKVGRPPVSAPDLRSAGLVARGGGRDDGQRGLPAPRRGGRR